MRLRPLVFLTVMLSAASVGTMIVSCTGDDGYTPSDASADVGPKDVLVPDAKPVDAGADVLDAADARDANDAGDASDAADTSVITPDATVILAHAQNEIEALCTLTRGCCLAAGQAQFDMAKCRTLYQGYGFQGDLVTVTDPVLRGGQVTVDTGKGSACYQSIRTLGCKNITSGTYSGALNLCQTTLQGTVPVNGNCRGTVECQTGNYCEAFSDGGVFPSDSGTGDAAVAPIIGRCRPIKAIGDTCASDEECAYRLNGNACDTATNKCVGPLANTSACRYSGQCSSKICLGTCEPQITDLISATECEIFR